MLMTEEAPSGVASITVNDEGESDRVVTLVYLSGILYTCTQELVTSHTSHDC